MKTLVVSEGEEDLDYIRARWDHPSSRLSEFAAHLRAWELLAASESPPCVILDGARQIGPLPKLRHITLLADVSGVELKGGIRPLPQGASWRAIAYYLPRGAAEMLVEEAHAGKLQPLDIWLNAYVTHFAWPPPYITSKSSGEVARLAAT